MPDNIVESLFGPTPWQIQQAQNQQLNTAADNYARQDPFQRAAGGMFRAGGMLAAPAMEAIGYQNPAIQQAQNREAVMASGGDLSTSSGLKAKADQFAAAGDQRTAMKLMIAAKNQEKIEQQMLIEQRKQILGERKQEFQEQDALDFKRQQLQQAYNIAKERAEDARLSAAERVAAKRDEIAARLQLGQMMIAMKQGQSGVGKPPMGYRFTPDGDLEAIPGGPADLKANAAAEQKAAGAAGLDTTLATLRSAYDRLEAGGGITSTKKSSLSNIGSSISSSGIGQIAGKMVGSENQSARNDVAMSRPALLASLMKATGMSAKQIDSNAELKLWLTTATDPTLDVEANRRALDSIESRYLSPQIKPKKIQNAPSYDADKEARYQEWKKAQGK